ncbi:MAG: hypothetical protein II877_00775 [Synergistaceae bacterium]|nr:hypothetical protein [Synergistaceae bacterium]
MMTADSVIQPVLSGGMSYCKFLSANDTGATGGHQSGILISKAALEILFEPSVLSEHIFKRTAIITWQDDFDTQSCFTWYSSKNELRITRLGRNFPYLRPEMTGALFVLVKKSDNEYGGYILEAEEDIDAFLDAFGMTPADTNRLIDTGNVSPQVHEDIAIREYISGLAVGFPDSHEMSAAARRICDAVYDRQGYIITNPDAKLLEWTRTEYNLFKALEHDRYGGIIRQGFSSTDEFIQTANQVLNRRKVRAGKSLEHHLSVIFDANNLPYSSQARTEGNKRPDFIFPSESAYHDMLFPVSRIIILAAKTTCKDRWRQILNEADRLKGRTKYLCALQPGISSEQLNEMESEKVQLIVPREYIPLYPPGKRAGIWTLKKFVAYVKELES